MTIKKQIPVKKKTTPKESKTIKTSRKEKVVIAPNVLSKDKDEKGRFLSGNELWKLWDGKNGKPRLFKSPIHLWEESMKYFEYCNKNPLIEIDFKGKDAERVELPRMRAFTWQGLELFLGIASLKDYKNKYAEYAQVIAHIGKIIYTQKLEGAAANLLNANIIARDLGLRDSTHMSVDDDRRIIAEAFPDILDSKKKID